MNSLSLFIIASISFVGTAMAAGSDPIFQNADSSRVDVPNCRWFQKSSSWVLGLDVYVDGKHYDSFALKEFESCTSPVSKGAPSCPKSGRKCAEVAEEIQKLIRKARVEARRIDLLADGSVKLRQSEKPLETKLRSCRDELEAMKNSGTMHNPAGDLEKSGKAIEHAIQNGKADRPKSRKAD